jgi:hypothetical protein
VVVDGERRRLHAHGDDDTRCGLAMLHRVMDRLSRLLDTAMIVWLFPGAARCRLTSGGGGDGIQGLNLCFSFFGYYLFTYSLFVLSVLILLSRTCRR